MKWYTFFFFFFFKIAMCVLVSIQFQWIQLGCYICYKVTNNLKFLYKDKLFKNVDPVMRKLSAQRENGCWESVSLSFLLFLFLSSFLSSSFLSFSHLSQWAIRLWDLRVRYRGIVQKIDVILRELYEPLAWVYINIWSFRRGSYRGMRRRREDERMVSQHFQLW